MAILVTGGAGYIGSHTVLCLLERGYDVIVLDNHSNSSKESLHRVSEVTGRQMHYYMGDVSDRNILNQIFKTHRVSDVIHFAGLKSVSESVDNPIKYYDNNVSATLVLLKEMINHEVFNIIFSSSATVYGEPECIPLRENNKTGGITNPYGRSKLFVEQIISDTVKSNSAFRATILRYFNPTGAHSSGLIGEDPCGVPCNLVPYITQVAIGKLTELTIYGDNYPTIDGTGIRDYIHVMDLAEGHIAALENKNSSNNLNVYNLGTGNGYSVLELISAFEKACGKKIPYKISARRAGDVAECWSDPTLAQEELKWSAGRDLNEMMRDSWLWQSKNPNGYN